MGKFLERFTFVELYNEDVKRVLISDDIRGEHVLIVAEPTGPDGVFVIKCAESATQHEVELMVKALSDKKIPYIQNQF